MPECQLKSDSRVVRRVYDSLASSYDARWKKYIDATLSLAVDALDLTGQERLLDVACGTGELERRLQERWPALTVTGLDVSPKMLKRTTEKRLSATILTAEASQLPFTNGSFDLAVCVNAFHYFRFPAGSLNEMRRVLSNTGRLVLVDWCDDYLTCKLCSAWLRWADPAFYQAYTLLRCRELLEESGFRVEQTSRRRIDWLWGLMVLVARPSAADDQGAIATLRHRHTL